ncbi:MAG: hypothetical protein SH859_14750 [Hyphomicrobium aestuarii]|nr:hypothetical protein [Hyphomicrobium aestuarii]
MFDPEMAGRAAHRATESAMAATTSYAEAMTAACSEMMMFGLDLWSAALSGFTGDPVPPARHAKPTASFGQSHEDWAGLPWLDPNKVSCWMRMASPISPLDFLNGWGSGVPLRGTPASWPGAMSMIDAGIPRSVAWPAAEANAAALDAAAAAVEPMRKVFATAHGDSGFASSPFVPKAVVPCLMFAYSCMSDLGFAMAGARSPFV